MAAVYAATHRNGRRAALKILHPELSLDRDWRRRFLREGRVANAVGHEGAVKVLDDDVADDGSVFLVQELLEGESLEARSQRLGGSLPEKEVLWIAEQLLDVLAAAHARGIVHRDIKPDNLFLTCSGTLKVLDFGIARLREQSSVSAATHNGGTMGTPAFMSPEQARALWDDVDAQSDLFAVGATMFTLLSGRYVHEGRTQNEELVGAMTVPARPLASVVPGVSASVARVVDGALAFAKDRRWPSAKRMQEAVRCAYRERTGRSLSMAPRPIVPEATAHGLLGLSTDVALSEHAALAVAKPSFDGVVERRRGRPSGVAVVLAAGAVAVVALGVALVRPDYPSAARAAAGAGPAAPARSAAVDAPPPQPSPAPSAAPPAPASPASPAAAASATDAHAAETAVGAPGTPAGTPAGTTKPSSIPKESTRPSCASPFVVDPVTHIKHWKVDCL
jgi:serine/threonine-protein kinase